MRYALALLLCLSAQAATVEEARLATVQAEQAALLAPFAELTADFARAWAASEDARTAMQLSRDVGQRLWQAAKARIKAQQDMDDRPLYWARLALTQTVHDSKPAFPIFAADRAAILAALEQASRGMNDVSYPADRHEKRILLTGFDPFLLDRHLDQSNPSGVNALLLDGELIELNGQRARIETAIFPVRYADFDAGMVERFLTPWMAGRKVDMVVTVSMGRSDFDLERFPGRRRSATAPDNLNVYNPSSPSDPQPPLLDGQPIVGPEFVEFSLPAAAMQQVGGPYKINDNRWVTVVPETRFAAGGLATLRHKVAVEGGGGGYLSNEISYRAVRLRDVLGVPELPVGHIHTPRIAAFEPDTTRAIAAQLRAMLRAALPALR